MFDKCEVCLRREPSADMLKSAPFDSKLGKYVATRGLTHCTRPGCREAAFRIVELRAEAIT